MYRAVLQNEILETEKEGSEMSSISQSHTFDPYSLLKYTSIEQPNSYTNKPIFFRIKEKIPKAPFKVLDAPALKDDFYLNLIDWSSDNILAVGLGS